MRRLLAIALSVALLAAANLFASPASSAGQLSPEQVEELRGSGAAGLSPEEIDELRQSAAGMTPEDVEDLRRGLIYDGLERVSDSDFCRGNFRLRRPDVSGLPVCTHGPDPAPPGVDVRDEPEPPALVGETATPGSGTALATQVPCVGNGTDGYRVHLIYARAADHADGYGSWLSSLQQYAARLDDVFNASAGETGGSRHIRFLHDAGCVPIVDNVVLSSSADDNFDNMLSELRSRGYSRTDRKYVVFMDANVYCGIAQVYYDDQPGQTNASNGHPQVAGEVARIDKGCWGAANMVEAHELTHVLGGVQQSAPHATKYNHCTDEYDRLCYADGGGSPVVRCSSSSHENRLDCNHDDYYSTNPPTGSYLATHWNTGNSRFLVASASSPTTTSPPTTSPPTTSPPTTSPPTTSPTTTTTKPPTTSTTSPPMTAPPTTSPPTTSPPATGSVPSAPQNAFATQPSGTAKGVLLYWSSPALPGSPPFTTYRIYRGTSWSALSPLVDVGAGTTSYADTATTAGTMYWYAVAAVNSTGQSPLSNVTGMIAR